MIIQLPFAFIIEKLNALKVHLPGTSFRGYDIQLKLRRTILLSIFIHVISSEYWDYIDAEIISE